jgi:GNAT superfamily N-acetyltransferase
VTSVEVRDLDPDGWAASADVAARAFFDEEFVTGMFGADALPRFAGVHHLYRAEEFDHAALHLGAFLDEVVVGVLRVSPVGACFVCTSIDPTQPPADPVLAAEWSFEVAVQDTHEGHPSHAWISRVAVEPALQGTGIGGLLLDDALARLSGAADITILLECLAGREGFYARHGFVCVGEVEDPFAELTLLMRRDLEAS